MRDITVPDVLLNLDQPVEMSEVDKEILESIITEDEIPKAIQHMKNGKSPGNDNVLSEMIKTSESKIMSFQEYGVKQL